MIYFQVIFLILVSFNVFAQGMSPNLDPNKFTICTVTINSDNEKKLFEAEAKKYPSKFNPIVELTNMGGEDWFENACSSGISCDQLVISGHFAGSFFGDSKKTLSLEELEKKSCSKSCEGILSQPYEVFLFGCNTLSGKEQDHRTPEQYLQVLIDDGFSAAQASQIVEARYGSVGDDNKSRMQRAFKGEKKQIYGFDSVGPSGKTVESFIKRYFSRIKPAEHLEKQQAKRLMNKVDMANKVLAETLKGTAFAQCETGNLENNDTRIICGLIDENLSVSEKLGLVTEALSTENYLKFIPAVNEFLKLHPVETMSLSDEAQLALLTNNQTIKNQIKGLIDGAKNLSLVVEWTNFAKRLGYITEDEQKERLKGIVLGTFKNNVTEADVLSICGIDKVNELIDLKSTDLKKTKLTKFDLAAIGCLTPKDPEIHKRLAGMLTDPDLDIRGNALAALGNEHMKDKDILAQMVTMFDDKDPRMPSLVLNTLGKTKTDDPGIHKRVANYLDSKDANQVNLAIVALGAMGASDETIQNKILSNLENSSLERKQMAMYYATLVMPGSVTNQEHMVNMIKDPEMSVFAQYVLTSHSDKLHDSVLAKAIKTSDQEQVTGFISGLKVRDDDSLAMMELIDLANEGRSDARRSEASYVISKNMMDDPKVREKVLQIAASGYMSDELGYALYAVAQKNESLKSVIQKMYPLLNPAARESVKAIVTE